MKPIKQFIHLRACHNALGRNGFPPLRPILHSLAGLWLFACLSALPAVSQRTHPNAPAPGRPPVDNTRAPANGQQPAATDTGIVHSQKLSSGVPLGGIGAGTFQLLTDGTVSHATLANNWLSPGGDAPGCFGAVWTQANGRNIARILTLNDAYHLPTIAKVDYDGLFPQARLTFPDPALPVSISLLAFSPIVPFDLKNSSFPGAALILRVKNPSTAPMEVSLALAWESLLSNPGTQSGMTTIIPSGEGFFGARFTGSDPDGEMTLLAYPNRSQATITAALWDASDVQPAWWNQFSQDGSVPDAVPGMTLKASRPAAVIAVHMTLKPGETAELPFAVSWYLKHLRVPSGEDVGHYYEIPFANAQNAARLLLEDWRSLYGLTEEWQKRLTFSTLPRWQTRRLINSAAPLTANTVHTKDGRFAFLGTIGNKDAAGNEGLTDIPPTNTPANLRQMEQDETRAHQAAQSLLLTLFPQLAAQELEQFAATQDSRGFVVPPADEHWFRRLGLPKPPHAPLVPTADALLANFAPPTPNTPRADTTRPGKSTPSTKSTPSKPTRPLPPTGSPAAPATPTPAPPSTSSAPAPSPALLPLNATAAYVLQWTQFALWTGETDFLKQHYSTLRLAIRALLQAQEEEEKRRKGEKEKGTGNREQGTEGANSSLIPRPSSLTLWLAALRGGAVLARMGGEETLAQECDAAFGAGSARLDAQHWNTLFYTEDVMPATRTKPSQPFQGDVCASDQLWGQWLAYQLDLGPLLPPAHLLLAAQSLQQRNDSSTLNAYLPPWQVRVDKKFLDESWRDCLLPASLLADAVVNIWQDQPEGGVSLLRRLDEARNTVLHSPWQYPARVRDKENKEKRRKGEAEKQGTEETQSGRPPAGKDTIHNPQSAISSSLAVASDWNILYALQGFALDVNAGRMTLAPNIPGTWRSLVAPVFAPTFWGRMEYRPTAHGGVTSFRLDRLIGFIAMPALDALSNRAELTLKTLRVQGPPRRENNTLPATFAAHISVGTKSIGSRSVLDKDGFVTLTFDSPLTLTAGDRLEVDIH